MTTLSVLKDQAPEEAAAVLAGVARSFLPDPGIESPPPLDAAQIRVREQVLNEVRNHLKLSAYDQSRQAQTKILDFLNKTMVDLILPPAKIPTVRARLGQRGDLRPELYQIKFGASFQDEEKRGIRRSHVVRAMQEPDAVEHLAPDWSSESPYPAFSLYLKHQGEAGPNRFILLVQAVRKDDVQLVGPAWRVYLKEVDLSGADSPLDVLGAFVEVYGLKLSIGQSEPRKFFLYVSIPLEEENETQIAKVLTS